MWLPKRASPMTMNRTNKAATARRWWRNRRSTISLWLRGLTVNSRSGPSSPPAPTSTSPAGRPPELARRRSSPVAIRRSPRDRSCPDPRVEDSVEQVGEQVEGDDDDSGDHQPRKQFVD